MQPRPGWKRRGDIVLGRCSAARLTAWGFVPLLLFSACASKAPAPVLMKADPAEATRYLEAGDYQGALGVMKARLRESPGNKEWAEEAEAAVDEIHGIAESAFRRRDYPRAERIYRLLVDSYGDFELASIRLAFTKAELEAGIRNCRISAADQAAAEALKSGEAAKSLDIYAAAWKEIPDDKDLPAKYLRAVREVKEAGETALDGKDYALAGRLNGILLQRYPAYQGMTPRVSFGKADLEAAIALCRDGLTKAGLAEYRAGNLAKAITIWESLLAFDPANAEIRKAVETARTQLKGIIKK